MSCKLCDHENRLAVEAAIVSGETSEAEIARLVGCHQSTVNRHKRQHMALSTQVLKDELEAIASVTELPDDLLTYGALKLINALESLVVKSRNGSYKADESIASVANALLSYEKRINERQQTAKGLGVFQYSVSLAEPSDLN